MRCTFTMTVEVGGHRVCERRDIVDVMKIGQQIQSWTRRMFNNYLRTAGRDVVVTAHYVGQITHPPFTMYRGSLSGVNRRCLRQTGGFEQ